MTATFIANIPGICTLHEMDGAYELQRRRTLSLIELRDSEIGNELMHRQNWYDD